MDNPGTISGCRYAAYYDNDIRMKSSSGAIFSLLANEVLEKKGIVYGVAMNASCTEAEYIGITENPKLLVTYHRIYHMNIQDNRKNLAAEMAWRDEAILDEIREAGYEGYVVNGKDLDVF